MSVSGTGVSGKGGGGTGVSPVILFDRRARFAFFVACFVLVASSLGFQWAVQALNIYLRKQPVEMRGSFSTIPKVLGSWRAIGEDRTLEEAAVEELGTRLYLDRTYANTGDSAKGAINVHLAYYTGMIDAVPHVPDRCLVAAGLNIKSLPANFSMPMDTSAWYADEKFINLATDEPYPLVDVTGDFTGQTVSIRLPVGDMKLRVTEFESEENLSAKIFSGYFFIANGRVAASPDEVRMLAFRPWEKYAYYCKIQFTFGGHGTTIDTYLNLVAGLTEVLLPEIMQRLPDWAEVERRSQSIVEPSSAQASEEYDGVKS